MTVVKTKEQTTVDQKLLDNFPVRSDSFMKASSEKVSDETRRVRCLQVVFHVLDHLQRWLQEHSSYRNRESSRVKAMGGKNCYKTFFLLLFGNRNFDENSTSFLLQLFSIKWTFCLWQLVPISQKSITELCCTLKST